VPGQRTVRYGGNTACVEIRADDELIILDAGSGIRELGLALQKEFGANPMKVSLLITHPHWDHIQGFPFFIPFYNDKNQIHIFGYDKVDSGLREILIGQMATPFFPIALYDLPGKLQFESLDQMDFNIGKVRIVARRVNHPGVCLGYRVFTSKGSICYLPDHEPYESLALHSAESDAISAEEMKQRTLSERAALMVFLRDADVLIIDSQYTDEEYRSHVGWGHGSIGTAISQARDANVRKLVLFHHDPRHDDEMIDRMVESARALAADSGDRLSIEAAREGAEITLG
jgi:phosphoribosyl 1,2-cyclic phosphodiesterase